MTRSKDIGTGSGRAHQCPRCDMPLPTPWARVFHDTPLARYGNTCLAVLYARRIALLQELQELRHKEAGR